MTSRPFRPGHREYPITLEREPDGGYVTTVPLLPVCISQGDTREEALANIREAMDLFIEDMLANGETPPAVPLL